MPSESDRYAAAVAAGGLAPSPTRPRPAGLLGRDGACRQLDQLVSAVRGGQSRVLVVRGEPGIGKTALLEYVAAHGRIGSALFRSLAFGTFGSVAWRLRSLADRHAWRILVGVGKRVSSDRRSRRGEG